MQLDFKTIFEFTIYWIVAGFAWLPVWWLLDILTPKAMLDRYFKEPHFNRGELIAFNFFPASLLRTALFSWLLWFPSLGKKRQLTDLPQYAPKWYAVSLKFFIFSFMSYGLVFVLLLGGSIVYTYLFH